MITYAVSSSAFSHLNLPECLRKAAQLGYGGVEAAYHDLFSFRRGPRQRYLEDEDLTQDRVTGDSLAAQDTYGTRLTGIHGPVVPLNAPDWHKRQWINEEAFRRMQRLGATTFTVHAGGGTVQDLDQELPLIEANLEDLADLGAAYGVTVCVESGCMPYEIHTIPALADLLDRHPRLAHTADLSHNYFHHTSETDPFAIETVLTRLGTSVRVVHVVDYDPHQPFAHDLPAGMGSIDWPRLLRGLLRQGFDGVLCCENTPDAITTWLLRLHHLLQGRPLLLPPSTVGTYLDGAGEDLREPDPAQVLGHDPYLLRLPFGGATLHWDGPEESWNGQTLPDLLCQTTLAYLKQLVSDLTVELRSL